MEKINNYIFEKLKINKEVVKNNYWTEYFCILPFNDAQDYLENNYSEYEGFVSSGYMIFILPKIDTKILAKRYPDDVDIYCIPNKYKKLEDFKYDLNHKLRIEDLQEIDYKSIEL